MNESCNFYMIDEWGLGCDTLHQIKEKRRRERCTGVSNQRSRDL